MMNLDAGVRACVLCHLHEGGGAVVCLFVHWQSITKPSQEITQCTRDLLLVQMEDLKVKKIP